MLSFRMPLTVVLFVLMCSLSARTQENENGKQTDINLKQTNKTKRVVDQAEIEARLEKLCNRMPHLLQSNDIKEAVKVQQEVVAIRESVAVKSNAQLIVEQLFLTELKKVESFTEQGQAIYHRANMRFFTGCQKSREEEYKTAIELLSQAIEDYRTMLGEGALAEALALDELAHAYLSYGDSNKAKESLLLNQKIWLKLAGKNHSGYATAMAFLGVVGLESDDLKNAEIALKEALPLLRKVYGARSIEYAESIVNLAHVKLEGKNWVEAEALCVIAKSILEEQFATSDLAMAHLHSVLASVNVAFEESEDAEKNFKQSLLLHRMYGNPNAPIIRGILNDYAALLRKLNRIQEAEELEKRASQIQVKKKLSDTKD